MVSPSVSDFNARLRACLRVDSGAEDKGEGNGEGQQHGRAKYEHGGEEYYMESSDDEGQEEGGDIRKQNDSGQDADDSIVMAITRKGNKVGFACFDELASTIFVAQMIADADLRETVQAIKLHLRPSLFLIDPHLLADEDFCKLLACAVTDDRQGEFQVKVVKTRNWDYNRALSNLSASLKVKELNEATRTEEEDLEDERMIRSMISTAAATGSATTTATPYALDHRRNYDRLGAILDFKGEPLLIKALGALILHLQTGAFQLELGGIVPVKSLQRFDLSQFLHLDSNTLSSLQIFHEEKHPNVISGRGRSKEGFSLFALLDQTRSRPGRSCLKEWMLKPLREVEPLKRRQWAVELFMQVEAMDVMSSCRRFLSKIADAGRCLVRLKRAIATYRDWLKLASTVQNALLIQNCLVVLHHIASRIRPEYAQVIQVLVQKVSRESLSTVNEAIVHVIDVELTRETKTLQVRVGCDEELDRLKAQFDELEEFLSQEARQLLEEQTVSSSRSLLSTLSVQYLPQIGYLMVIDANERLAIEDDPSYRFVFAQGESLFYKTPRMDYLDDQIGDIQASIRDKEDALLRTLADQVLEEEVLLTEAVRTCAELDVLIAFSSIAGGLNWVCPQLTTERVIIIKDGRHPLQELTVDAFIPNDTYLTKDRSLAVVTGPNFSGKSVYIKQVAVLVYLAHLGSFIPCQQALIGLVDGIYTRISSAETVTVQQSTFTIDLSQMNTIFRRATENSLVLVDEFGKGSAETDGLALLLASLAQLQRLQARTLVTTHFLEIFHDGLIPPVLAQEICFRMDVFIPPAAPHSSSAADAGLAAEEELARPLQTIIPLFKLTKGTACSSGGVSCAVLAGLALPVVKRAEFIAQSHVDGNLPIMPLTQPLLPVLQQKVSSRGIIKKKDEENKGGFHDEQKDSACHETSALTNVIRYNDNARRILEEFQRFKQWKDERSVSDDELHFFFNLLKAA